MTDEKWNAVKKALNRLYQIHYAYADYPYAEGNPTRPYRGWKEFVWKELVELMKLYDNGLTGD